MLRIISILAAAAVLWPGSGAFAAEWLKLTSPNFEMFTTANERKGREAILYFEQVRDLFLRIRPGSLVKPLPVRLIAFQNEKEFRRFRFNEFSVAYYLGGDTRDYIVMQDISAERYPVAVHEYSHLLVKHAGLKLPRWLDEGWADVNSTVHPVGGQVTIGNVIPGRAQLLGQTKWMPLDTLTKVDFESAEYNEKTKAGIFYAQSWLLTHMLYLSDGYRPKFSAFVTKLANGSSSEEAFREIYGKSLVEVTKDLEGYMRSGSINVAVFAGKMEQPSEHPTAQPASDLESGLVQADLLTHLRKTAEAKAIYGQLSAGNPKSWEVEQALAYLAWRASDSGAAQRHFGRAMELGCDDGEALFDYAKLLQGDHANDPLLAKVLMKAVGLRPDLTEARMMLGFHFYNTQDYSGAVDQLSRIKKVTQERAVSFCEVLARSQYETGHREDAKASAQKARQFAVGATDIKRADDFLELLAGNSVPQSQRLHAEGTLQSVECLGTQAKIHVLVGGRKQAFLIVDPSKIEMKKAGALEIVCGAQKGETVLVEYGANADASLKADGILYALEIKGK